MIVDFKQASEEIKKHRRDICNLCPHIRAKFKILGITLFNRNQCTKCWCIIKAKTSLKIEKCPIEKW